MSTPLAPVSAVSGLAPAANLSQVAGSLRVVPGAPPPVALQSTRQDWAARLGRGQAAGALPGLMASLFNLCGHAHRLCVQLAIGAAAPGLLPAPQPVAQRLRTETAQEHIRRIGLDWPRLLATSHHPAQQAQLALQRCPLLAHGIQPSGHPWPATLVWLEAELLQMPATDWLQAWQAHGPDWLWDWSQRHSGWLAAVVRVAHGVNAGKPLDGIKALRVQASGAELLSLSHSLDGQAGFALHPQWRGACAHTGSWARLASSEGVDRWAMGMPLTPWALLGSRLAELVRLCLPDAPGQSGAGWLSFGALATGPRQGLAWVEMARGLLVHQVVLEATEDGGPAQGAQAAQAVHAAHGSTVALMPRVARCAVLAPTEWNFHPHGVVAQSIASLDPDRPADEQVRSVCLLMAAFDPCVPFEVALQPARQGGQHA